MLFKRSTKHCEGHDRLCLCFSTAQSFILVKRHHYLILFLFAGGLLTFVIGAGPTLAWTVAKDCYPGEVRSIRKEEWEVLVTMHARGRSSSGFQGESRFFPPYLKG